MRVQGKDIFTFESVHKKDKVVKDKVAIAIAYIKMVMEENRLTLVEL